MRRKDRHHVEVSNTQYIVLFPEAGCVFEEQTSSLLSSPGSLPDALEKLTTLAVTPTLVKITNFAEPRMTASGNSYTIKAGVFSNLQEQGFKDRR